MFESPWMVMKGGHVLVEDGELRDPAAVPGRTFRAGIDGSTDAARTLHAWRLHNSSVHPRQVGLSTRELESLETVPCRERGAD